MLLNNPLPQALFWSVMTIALYVLGKALHHRRPCWWTSPLVVTSTSAAPASGDHVPRLVAVNIR